MRETRNYYTTPSNPIDHTLFGGLICYSDFNTDFRKDNSVEGSSIANDILSDWKFDEQCRKNAENRDRKYKKGTN